MIDKILQEEINYSQVAQDYFTGLYKNKIDFPTMSNHEKAAIGFAVAARAIMSREYDFIRDEDVENVKYDFLEAIRQEIFRIEKSEELLSDKRFHLHPAEAAKIVKMTYYSGSDYLRNLNLVQLRKELDACILNVGQNVQELDLDIPKSSKGIEHINVQDYVDDIDEDNVFEILKQINTRSRNF